MSLSRKILKNMAAQVAGRLYTSAASFVVTMVLLARLLVEADFGIFNYYLTFYYIFVTIIDFGSNTIAIREASKDPTRLPGLLHALIRIRGLAAGLCFLVVCGAAFTQEEDGRTLALILVASTHLLAFSLGGYNAVFHIYMRFDRVALVSALGHTIFLGASLAAYFAGCKDPAVYLIAYGAGMAATNVANYLMSRPFLIEHHARYDGGARSDGVTAGDELKALFREALPLGISSIMATLYFNVDTLLLRPLQSEAAVGQYNAAYRLLTFSIMVPVLFNQVVFPVFSRAFTDREARSRQRRTIFRRAVLYMGVVGLPATCALFFYAEPLIVLVSGEKYRGSAGCLRILGLAIAAIFLTYPHISVLVASGRQAVFAWIAGLSGLLNVGLNVYFIPRYGIEGAAWTTVATEGLVLLSAVICAWRFTGLNALGRVLIPVPILAGLTGLGAWWLSAYSIYFSLPLLGAGYLGLLYLFRVLPFSLGEEAGTLELDAAKGDEARTRSARDDGLGDPAAPPLDGGDATLERADASSLAPGDPDRLPCDSGAEPEPPNRKDRGGAP